jgi:hypothetical protein
LSTTRLYNLGLCIELTSLSIVFIHGLTGGSTSTWRAKGASLPWPQRLLASDLSTARIMTYGYDADVVHPLVRAGQNPILVHAKNLVGDLRNKRDTQDSETRPLIFVAHSLGGLVCEKVFASSKSDSSCAFCQRIWRLSGAYVFWFS